MKYLFSIFQIVLIVLPILLVVIFVVVMLSENPERIFNLLGTAKNGESKYETLKFLGIGTGGVLVALQALMSYRRAKAMEDAVEKTEQGQRQDRLKNAIEHLGHKSDSVRLGGAYELFHLAKDIEDLRQTVLDILCAHIRQTTGEYEYQKKHKVPEDVEDVSEPSEEVQSLLNLLFVQEHDVFKGLRADLRGSWMIGADLRMARLENAVLVGADLQEVDFTKANLQGANLTDTQLQAANLTEANLQWANLNGAQLQGANLTDTQLQAAELPLAQLQEAVLWRANLQMAKLRGAQLQASFLCEAKLQGANLAKAQLQAAELCFAQLQEANLMEAKLQGITSNKALFDSFEERINDRIGKENELNGATFEGELRQEDLASIVTEIPDEEARKSLQKELKKHIKSKNYGLPNDHGAFDEPYTDEEAKQWIAEYKEAVVSTSI